MSLIVALALAAPGQEPWDFRDPTFTVGVFGRLTLLDGVVVDNFPFDDDVTYSDLFRAGEGIRVEAGMLWWLAPGWELGPLLTVGFDRFEGTEETDTAGDTLEPEELTAARLLVGVRTVLHLEPGVWWDQRVSVGAVRWSDVDATLTVGGVPMSGISFLEGATRFSVDLGTHLGVQIEQLVIAFGLGINGDGPPRRGSDVSSAVDPGPVVAFYVDLGLEVQF